jgi:hypothetical protein
MPDAYGFLSISFGNGTASFWQYASTVMLGHDAAEHGCKPR